MMARVSEIAEHWLGLCRKAPTFHTAPAILVNDPVTALPAPPAGNVSPARRGRIRDGISIATGSLMATFRDRQLLWFTLLSGLVMLFLILAQGWSITHVAMTPSFSLDIPVGDSTLFIDLQNQLVALPSGNSSIIIDLRVFLMEMICLSGFILILACLVLYRNGNRGKTAVTVHEGCAIVRASFWSLTALSVGMAFVATIVFVFISHSQFFGSIVHGITMALFWLPYEYYHPGGFFSVLYTSANFFALEIMAINSLLFLAALYLVPAIVLEKKGLIPALAGSVTLFRRTWREVLGCILVFGFIVLGVAAVGVVIGQSPTLLNHDYDFFISRSRGYLPMMIVCYGFIVACWILMAAGFSAAGVAIADLYRVGKSNGVSDIPEGSLKKPEPAS
ncbi:hypothetical protein [Methanoregula sp.]|uniref:hypothetical protein n=1 Tax=Methanoregula sp. TaxID=2052170 RepID=UPI003C71F9C5